MMDNKQMTRKIKQIKINIKNDKTCKTSLVSSSQDGLIIKVF